MSIPPEVLEETRRRFEERKRKRAANVSKIDQGDLAGANDNNRLEMRARRIVEFAEQHNAASVMGANTKAIIAELPRAATDNGFLERVIGKSDFVGAVYFELGLAASTTVGRIRIGSSGGGIGGFGTGSMISPRLLLTNNHVLPDARTAARSQVEFNYQQALDGSLRTADAFNLDPRTFFATDPALDFTVVAVRETSTSGIPLSRYGFNRVIEQVGKVIVGEAVNIIQHPQAQPKQIALRANEMVDILEDFLHYRTDTSPGSSGAPLFNDQWELLGIHHSGVPRMDKKGRILTRDGRLWDRDTMGEEEIDWTGNEGVRISRIINHLKGLSLSNAQRRLLDEAIAAAAHERITIMNGNGTDHDGSAEPESPEPELPEDVEPRDDDPVSDAPQPRPVSSVGTGGDTVVTIPIEISVRIGAPGVTVNVNGVQANVPGITAPNGASVNSLPASDLDEALRPEDYADRKGYETGFLGTKFPVPLPKLSKKAMEDVARRVDRPTEYELKYTHFSLVMNKRRRLPFFTAVNIDGSRRVKIKRDADKWILDARLRAEEQIGNALYAGNLLDRGHLVRREDPVWGTGVTAQLANDDTFHYTNCAPQHEALNQRTWLSLESYILENADVHNLKVCVFTGPVFRPTDRLYRSVQIPEQFWKVVSIVRGDTGKMSVTAYMLSQKQNLLDLEEAFAFGAFETYQVPVQQVETLTGLDFGKLREFDPLRKKAAAKGMSLQESFNEIRTINVPGDIVL